MPILHVGDVKTSPIPQTMQSDVPSKNTFIWQNTKEDDGTSYSRSDLIKDITNPILSSLPSSPSWGDKWKVGLLTDYVNGFSKFMPQSKEIEWMDKWSEAFQSNPTVDISKMIKDTMLKELGKFGDGTGWLDQALKSTDGDTTMTQLIVAGLDKFFNGLQASLPAFIDIDQIETEMNTQVADEIKKFSLDASDPGLDYTSQLVSESLKTLEDKFKNAKYETTTPNRPYRVFSQADVKTEVLYEFKRKFHTQMISDEITEAAFNKAIRGNSVTNKAGETIDNLQTILSTASGKLDSRFIEALQQIDALHLKTTPVEIFEKLLGTNCGDKFISWYDQWKWLIDVSHTEQSLSGGDKEKVSMNLKLRDGVNVIPADGKYPNVNVIFANTPLEETVSTVPLDVSSVSYITDLFQQFYKTVPAHNIQGNINEEDLSKIFKSSNPSDGQIVEDLTPTQIEDLYPKGLANLEAAIKNKIQEVSDNLSTIYPSFTYDESKVKISFKVTFHDDGSKRSISIVPKISDGNISGLPGIDWAASSITPLSDQQEINKIFDGIDKDHKELDYSGFDEFSLNVVAAIDDATQSLWDIFNNNKVYNGDSPFRMDILGSLGVGEEIPLTNFVGIFSNLQTALNKFDTDYKSRYTVIYKIKELSDKKMSIEYEITDTKNPTIKRTMTLKGNGLDNISIDFNESLDKGQALLDKLQKSNINLDQFKTHTSVEEFGKRTPIALTQDEFNNMFKDFSALAALGKNNGITLAHGAVEDVPDSNGNDIYFMNFETTFKNTKGADVQHELKIQISHTFLSQKQIDNANAEIDQDAIEATEAIGDSFLSKEYKDQILERVTQVRDKLKDEIKREGPDMSEQKLQRIIDESNKLKTMAVDAAMEAKYEQVYEELNKEFPEGIPPEVDKLFKENWESFEQIIKNDPSVLHDIKRLKDLLKTVSPDQLMNAQRSMQVSGKVALAALGGLLSVGAGVGGANAVKVATTNKKAAKSKTGKIKSSKKLAILSALIGLASLGGSIGTFLYLFLVQGGL